MTEHLRVLEPGPFSTIQDRGRYGYQRYGISASGALDPLAMALANAIAGSAPGTAVIEMTLSGPTLEPCGASARFAYAGPPCRILHEGRVVPPLRSFDVQAGERVSFGPITDGMRGYIAVAGLRVEPVLGSCSTHSRSAIGGIEGRPLRGGDSLSFATTDLVTPCLELVENPLGRTDGLVRVLLGPQAEAFTRAGLETFLSQTYRMTGKADRMGCQLDGPAIEHATGFNIVSDAIVNGSIQVPGHGRPIVLLADRQTTGGYPKIATVITPDLRKLAQALPGDEIRFEVIERAEAEQAARGAEDEKNRLLRMVRSAKSAGGRIPTSAELLDLNLVSGVISGEDPSS